MQDQVNEKTVALSVKASKMTGHLLAQSMRAYLNKARAPKVTHGKQSLKSLVKQGASLSNIQIDRDNIGSFKQTVHKYNIDFALKRDNSESPPKWMVFFKAKDADALTAAFNEYSKILRGEHALLRGKDGVVVCKVENGVFTSVHTYWAQMLKRELGAIDPPENLSVIKRLDEAKTKAAAQNKYRSTQKRTMRPLKDELS